VEEKKMNKTKLDRFGVLAETLLSAIRADSFVSETQKDDLCAYVRRINQDMQSGRIDQIETRLCIARNTLASCRKENLLRRALA
jgi:hypothetical protein